MMPRAAVLAALLLLGGARASQPSGEVPTELLPTLQRGASILLELQENLGGGDAAVEWPYEGVYREGGEIPLGYRVGGTSICAWSLLELPDEARTPEVTRAIERGLDFVLSTLADEGMSFGFRGGYDVRGWGHTYALTFLLRLRAHDAVPKGSEEEVDRTIADLVQILQDSEIPRVGGWAYSRRGGLEASGPSCPFMTAPTLLALFEAEQQGESVDAGVVKRGLKSLEACRTPDGDYTYSSRGGRGEAPGAIGRTPAIELTLLAAGRSDPKRLRRALDAFFEHWEWLEKRRRQTGTHVEPYGIAPYYFFYAHYYAAVAIERLAPEDRAGYRARFLARLFEVQEESGGWNDRVFPRSENFGTAMSLLALRQPELAGPRGPATTLESSAPRPAEDAEGE